MIFWDITETLDKFSAYKDAKRRADTWKSNLQTYLFSLKERIEKMKDSKEELKKTCDSECGDGM